MPTVNIDRQFFFNKVFVGTNELQICITLTIISNKALFAFMLT